MVLTRRVEGEVEYNDGEIAEVQTIGIEGIEKDLLLDTLRIHRKNTEDTPEEFRQRFPVGVLLEIVTTTEIRAQSDAEEVDLSAPPTVQ